MAAYVTVAVLATFLWLRDDDAAWAPLAGVAAGAAAWCKVEGLFTCGVLLVTALMLRRSLRLPGVVPWLAWFLIFVVPWQLFREWKQISRNASQFADTHLDPVWIVMHVGDKLVPLDDWGVFWAGSLLIVLMAAPLWWPTSWRTLAALTIPNVVLTLGAFVKVYDTSDGAVRATAPRLYVHLTPSVAVMVAAATYVAWTAYDARRGALTPRASAGSGRPRAAAE